MEYCLDNGTLSVRVSSLGGELQSVKKDGKEYLWQGDPAYWDSKAPNLFPYIARLTKETCTVHGKAYRMPIHGFLPTTELTAEVQEKERQEDGRAVRLVLRLDADERTLACYPFMFTLRIIYELKEDTLRITYEVENDGAEEMYFGIGGHPGFQAPLEDGLSFEDYFLEFEPEKDGGEVETPVRVGFSAACFLNGEDQPYPLQEEGGSRCIMICSTMMPSCLPERPDVSSCAQRKAAAVCVCASPRCPISVSGMR